MKRILFYLLPAVAVVALLAGCKKPKWDYPNTEIGITLFDAEGNDKLTRWSSVFDNDITIEYNGETYSLIGPTRAAGPELPVMKGVRWKESITSVPNQLLFGEFSVDTKQYRKESFTIDWGDGNRNEIEFDLYTTSNGRKKQPTIHEATWVDGVENSNTLVVRIVRE